MAETAQTNATIGTFFAGIGSVAALVGAGIELSSSVKDARNISNWDLNTTDPSSYLTSVLIGAGFIIVSIPFLVSSNKQLKKSVSLYNSKHVTGFRQEQNMYFRFSPTGLRLTYNF